MNALFTPRRSRSRTDSNLEMPSPASIVRATAAIRKHWSLKTRLSRAGEVTDRMTVTEMTSFANRKGYRVDVTRD